MLLQQHNCEITTEKTEMVESPQIHSQCVSCLLGHFQVKPLSFHGVLLNPETETMYSSHYDIMPGRSRLILT